MPKTEAWYVGERAESLAIVHLTRRQDLLVASDLSHEDKGIDLLVTLKKHGQRTGRVFGVVVKGTVSSEGLPGKLIRYVSKFATEELGSVRDVPFPVCLFFFAVDQGLGHYGWIVEPVHDAKTCSKLRVNKRWHLETLNGRSIDRMVAQVTAWYDARSKSQQIA